jgi:hypothetical protein
MYNYIHSCGMKHLVPDLMGLLCWVEGYMRQVDIKQYSTQLKTGEVLVVENTAQKAR